MRKFVILIALLLAVASPAAAHGAHPFSIPDYCSSPTKTATGGNWNTAGSWSPSGVPGAADIVTIPNGVTITHDLSNAVAGSVCIEGLYTWGTTGSLGLTVDQLVVEDNGELRIGTSVSPFTGTATITGRGTCVLAQGTVMSPGSDPEAFGCGLLVFGKIRMHGVAKTPFIRLGAAVAASASTVTLASVPTAWKSGDEIFIPESIARNVGGTTTFQLTFQGTYEEGLVTWDDRTTLSADVTTTTASLTAATAFAHPCAKDKTLTCNYYAHVGNLTRNITLQSETPITGTRWHSLYTGQADVDIRYVRFKGMGRTTDTANLNCTLRTTGASQNLTDCVMGTGTITQIGTNQKGRYAVHFHHLPGPTNGGNTGYQGTFIGNAVDSALKWPISIHWTDYFLIQSNVVAYGRGAGIMLEEYNEHYNVIDGNFVSGQRAIWSPRAGVETADAGLEAAGIWGKGGQNNYIRNNVVAGLWNSAQEIVTEVGYKFFVSPSANATSTRIPNFRGASLETGSGEYTSADANDLPILEFSNNECYAMSTCMTVWHIGTSGYSLTPNMAESVVSGMICWHTWEQCFLSYPINHFTFDGMIVRGDSTRTTCCFAPGTAIQTADYLTYNTTVRNASVHHVNTVFATTSTFDGPFLYENSESYAKYGIETKAWVYGNATTIPIGWGSGVGLGANPGTSSHVITIRNVVHTTSFTNANQPIYMDPIGSDPPFSNYRWEYPVTVNVINYQGGPYSFDVYFNEQATQHWAGRIAPCTDTTTVPEVVGIVCNRRIPTGHFKRFFRQRIR